MVQTVLTNLVCDYVYRYHVIAILVFVFAVFVVLNLYYRYHVIAIVCFIISYIHVSHYLFL